MEVKSKVASRVTASCAVELTDRSRLSPAPVPEALGSSPLAMPWPLGCQLPGSTSRSATPPTSQGNLADRPDAVPLPLLRRLPHHRDLKNVTLGCPPGLCRRDGQVSVSAQPATGAPIKRHFRARLRGRGHARQVRQVKQAAPPRRGGPRLGSGRPEERESGRDGAPAVSSLPHFGAGDGSGCRRLSSGRPAAALLGLRPPGGAPGTSQPPGRQEHTSPSASAGVSVTPGCGDRQRTCISAPRAPFSRERDSRGHPAAPRPPAHPFLLPGRRLIVS